MITGPSEVHADCVGCHVLLQPSDGDILEWAVMGVEGDLRRTLGKHNQALGSTLLYEGLRQSGGPR